MAQYTARSIATIKAQIIAQKNSYSSLSELNSPSATAIWNLWIFIQAVAINLFEQILQIFSTNLETELTDKTVGTTPWIYANSFLFQYDPINPQIVIVDPVTYVIGYPQLNTNLQIITRCSIQVRSNNIIGVKVAKNNPAQALTSSELSAFQSYLNTIMPAIQTNAISLNPDQIRIQAQIYYSGMYSAVIVSTVQAAINNYISSRPFGGTFVVSQIEEAILAVPGVTDIDITQITARLDTQPFNLVGNSQVFNKYLNNRIYKAYSGYLIPETTAGNTLNETLTYFSS